MCLLTFLLPVFSLLPHLPICKWHFLGWEGGPGPQVCALSLPGRGPPQSKADACGALSQRQRHVAWSVVKGTSVRLRGCLFGWLLSPRFSLFLLWKNSLSCLGLLHL